MSIENFIPLIWSETLYTNLDKKYIGVENCNRDFEADVKEKGAAIRISGIGSVDVKNYDRNTDMGEPQTLNDTSTMFIVDQAKYFNFQIDDVDNAQTTPKLMSAAMSVAADALANEADKYVYGLYENVVKTIRVNETTADNIISTILSARRKLYEQNVSNPEDIVIEVSPAVAELIFKAKINLGSDNMEMLENGCIGKIAGCKVFVSNNIHYDDTSTTGITFYKCLMRTKRAIAFTQQISEIEAYRPEHRFADAVKGLCLYGGGIIYENEIIVLDFGVRNN